MKNIVILLVIVLSYPKIAFSQIAIGSATLSSNSVLVQFGSDNYTNLADNTNISGIILPIVSIDSTALTYSNGTFLVDNFDKTVKIRWKDKWKKLSDIGSFAAITIGQEIVTTPTMLSTFVEDVTTGVVIGDSNTNVDGVVVFNSLDKAVVLPKIYKPHLNVPLPMAGMLCYDTAAEAIAIFDGKVWSYWR